MIPPAGMAIAAITIMLWIVWSDTMRTRRSSQMLYAMRIAVYLVVSGVFILNLVRYPGMFAGTARGLCIAAVVLGLAGAAYFARRLVRRV
jgi:low affinity Fe/Cu permease